SALAKECERKSHGYADIWLYKNSGYYADALEYYMRVFGKENVKIFFYDEFLHDNNTILQEICSFAGVELNYRFQHVSEVNKSGLPKLAFVAKLLAPNMFTYILRRIIPQGAGRVVRKVIKDWNTGSKPILSNHIRVSLLADYKEDILRVESLVGRQSGWLR
ncbi:MAG: hypothetical protein IME94_06850, partial [Proteobacteria bacterium]|nr:hypothetical protein [Pseudomonadota bacterium]